MSAAVVFVVGPVWSGKTHSLLARYREVAAEGVGAALWLAPTDRACAEILKLAVEPGGALLAPNVVTFPEFARQLVKADDPGASTLSEFHQRALLDEVLDALGDRGAMAPFQSVAGTRGFADALFGLLTELKGQGIAPGDFARTASEVARGKDGRAKDRACLAAFTRYQQRLEDGRLLDRDATYRRAGVLIRGGRLGTFAPARAVFVNGFADFTPPQFDLLAALTGHVEQLWVAVVHDHDGRDDRSELFKRPLDTLAQLYRLPASKVALVRTDAGDVLHEPRTSRPAGLAHLERELFKPPRAVAAADDASGVSVIEAPGLLGEVRLVARAVKKLLLAGTAADRVIVAARDLGPYADLVQEVFDDYGLPFDLEVQQPLQRAASVRTLLRAARLADDDFPFVATTALLRSSFLRPVWPEALEVADVAQHAEVLLRLLGEPRGRVTYLRAAAAWADRPRDPLEDEQGEESRRRRTHDLARRCLPFLERFFRVWDGLPDVAPLVEHVEHLRAFADGLGFEDAGNDPAWGRFWFELEQCAGWEGRLHRRPPQRSRATFLRLLGTMAGAVGVPRTPGGPGRVRVVAAEQARHLDCDHLFLLGLGERGFPQLGSGGPLYDDAERQQFRQAGLELRCAEDRLPEEMLLFYQLATRPRLHLTLSFPAVDEKGQPLLCSSFLTAVRDCFEDTAIPVTGQRMLVEGVDRVAPLSPAELRVRWACAPSGPPPAALGDDLAAHLLTVSRAAALRSSREFSRYDGLVRDGSVLADLGERFGPAKVFSPTALESYIACPFRFFLQHVLQLQPLEHPGDEVEHTRRGAAFHRALSRLHFRLRGEDQHGPADGVEEQLSAELHGAVEEYAARVHSRMGQTLWRLEGRRLARAALRYRRQWEKFLEPWRKHHLTPRPDQFELEFGLAVAAANTMPGPLALQVEGVEVRIGGRIDRIDVVDLPDGSRGFWVIDYKTGRSTAYSAAELQQFQRLQLSLYALAAERVLLVDARPLGLAYWMVADAGPKVALPGRGTTAWLADDSHWPRFRAQLEAWVATLVRNVRSGTFPLKPRSEHCMDTCAFGKVCRIAQSRRVPKDWELSLPGSNSVEDGES